MDLAGWQEQGELLLRVALSGVFVIPLGWERERRKRSAGLRTHMLVSIASAAFMCLAGRILVDMAQLGGGVRVDQLRVTAAIVGGVSFVGAGSIFRAEDRITGLTTATSLWATAAIGSCVGSGYYVLGGGVALIVFVVLFVGAIIEARYRARWKEKE